MRLTAIEFAYSDGRKKRYSKKVYISIIHSVMQYFSENIIIPKIISSLNLLGYL